MAGGYTGAISLRTIVAYTPQRPRIAARLRLNPDAVRQLLGGALAVAVVAAIVAVAWSAPDHEPAPPPGPPQAFVSVEPGRVGPAIPRDFLGLSVEWDSLAAYVGAHASRAHALRRLLAPLRTGGRELALRVGGDTADQAWWNPGGRPRPRTVLQDITPRTLGHVAALARAAGGPVTIDVNLALGQARNARALAQAAARALPAGALQTLELGNEPDLYARGHTFRVPGHVHRRVVKDRRYDLAAYRRAAGRYLDALTGAVPGRVRLAVGGFAGPHWWTTMPRLLDGWQRRPDALTAHLYGLAGCAVRTPRLAWLMSAEASRERVATLATAARVAERAALPWRVTELNSAPCGGRRHFSDTSAGALWLADTLVAIVRRGAIGADVHTWDHALYAPFAPAGRGMAARPPFAGLLAFARFAPPGSRLAEAHVTGAHGPRAWASRGADGAVRVLLIAPRAVRMFLSVPGRRCVAVWTVDGRGRRVARRCTAQPVLSVALGARSLGVVTLA